MTIMDNAIDFANKTLKKLERIGVKDLPPGSQYDDGEFDSGSSIDDYSKATVDLEAIGLS